MDSMMPCERPFLYITDEAAREVAESYDALFLKAINLLRGYLHSANSQLFYFAGHGGSGKTQLLRFYYDYYRSHVEAFYYSFPGLTFTTPLDYRKCLEPQLQQIGITLPEKTYEEAYYAYISAKSRAMEVAKQQEESSKEVSQTVAEALQQCFHSFAIFVFEHVTAILRRFVIAQRRLQYLAAQIHNRVTRSPSPFRHEPPVGGIKVGGKLASFVMSSCGVSLAL